MKKTALIEGKSECCFPCSVDNCVKQLGGFFRTAHGERSILWEFLRALTPNSSTANSIGCLAQFEAIYADYGAAKQAVDRLKRYFQRRKETLPTEVMWSTGGPDRGVCSSKEMHKDLDEALTNARFAHALLMVRRWLVTDLSMSPDEQTVLSNTMRCGMCHGPISSRVKLLTCMHMVCASCSRKSETPRMKKG